METLFILSPHLDDAAFSLGIAMTHWAASRLTMTVVNCYTCSDYAPYSKCTSVVDISAVRLSEDTSFLSSLSVPVASINLGRLDAPIRTGAKIPCLPRPLCPNDSNEIEELGRQLTALRSPEAAWLLPMALGNHIDHRIVQNAALRVLSETAIGFYEDLPYANEYTDKDIDDVAAGLSELVGEPLYPFLVANSFPDLTKVRIATMYKSQVGAREIEEITAYSTRRGNSERLWLTASLLSEFSFH